MYDNLEALVTANIKLLETDDTEKDEVIRELLPEEEYESLNLLSNIGTVHFKEDYLRAKDYIQNMRLKKQIALCMNILDKLEDTYDIVFLENVDFEIKNNIKNAYKFLEFIEYDHINFISTVWNFLNVDLLKINIEEYCIENSNRIIQEIEKQLDNYKLPVLVSKFFRTNTKDVIIDIFIRMTEKSKIEIRIELSAGGNV